MAAPLGGKVWMRVEATRSVRIFGSLLVGLGALAGCDAGGTPPPSSSAAASPGSATPSASDQSADEGDEVLATVNGTPITRADVGFLLMGGHGRTITPELRKQALDKLIELELVYQRGLELGLDKDKKYRAQMRKQELRLAASRRKEMMRRVGNVEIAAKVKVSEAEARAYFDKHADAIKSEFHLGALTFGDAQSAKAALAKLRSGEAFEELAKGTAKSGGGHGQGPAKPPWDLGFLKWKQMPSEWAEAVSSLQPGEVTGVVHGLRTGTRILKLIAKRESPDMDFDAVKAAIMNRLRDDKAEAARAEYLSELERKAKVVRLAKP